ncbi:hypothetical protein [Myxosarcina sp. GI1]|uniref:hypothetical protein n=1 Tax=Myxosarcina sp. GI1 TaxID=1541065 RepID=UPI00068A3CF5|nr:hypothetical protein [Myxosarcina sp. GI1]
MNEPFWFSNGQRADSAEDLIKLCQQFPEDSSRYLVSGDFENWLTYIGKTDLARYASEARQNNLGDLQKLEEFLTKCNASQNPQPSKDKLAIEERPSNFVTAIRNFFNPNRV